MERCDSLEGEKVKTMSTSTKIHIAEEEEEERRKKKTEKKKTE